MMKKAFTLVEMLVVVVVLVTLMTIAFRLSSIGSDSDARAKTISRMQRLENCLSGYYAAFGSYPPVHLHGSRNIYLKTNGNGIQDSEGEEGKEIWGWKEIGEKAEQDAWNQVNAACRAQPIASEYPFAKGQGNDKRVKVVCRQCQMQVKKGEKGWTDDVIRKKFENGFDDLVDQNGARHSKLDELLDWREIQLFKFGLTSYLLPRYLVMMNSDERFYDNSLQWCGNNILPTDALTGSAFNTWNEVRDYKIKGEKLAHDYARVANIPSQAVCARWLPNLAGICDSNCDHNKGLVIMGVNVDSGRNSTLDVSPCLPIYSPNKDNPYSDQYVLDGVTVRDGWGNEFYYYSAQPYQHYQLWSAGPNGRTFPPWVDRKTMSGDANRCIGKWIQDDITHLSN